MEMKRETILRVFQTPESRMFKFLANELTTHGYREKDILRGRKNEWMFIRGEIPVLVVAHVDTVHRELPDTIVWDDRQGILWSPFGIGGDDRAGCLAILKMVEEGVRPYLLFTTEEERGCIGAEIARRELPVQETIPLRFMVELDRKGFNDAVFYDYDLTKEPEFERLFTENGFRTQIGSFTDISVLAPAWNLAAVNLSAGYYMPHSTSEHVYLADVWRTVHQLIQIFDKAPNRVFVYHEKPKAKWTLDKRFLDPGYTGPIGIAKDQRTRELVFESDFEYYYPPSVHFAAKTHRYPRRRRRGEGTHFVLDVEFAEEDRHLVPID